MAIATLTIDINAKLANLERDLGKVSQLAEQSAKRVDSAWKTAGKTFVGAFAVGASTAFLGSLQGIVQQAIDAADQLNDLSKQTGVAVDTLGGLGFAATMAGGNLETVTAATDKLNKAIAGAAAGKKEMTATFDAIGISVRTTSGEIKKADAILVELANKFKGYADGPNKAAIAQKLMEESGLKMISMLNEGGDALQENIEYYKRYSGVTAETAKAADEFNDTMAKLHLLTGSFGRTLASELLPTLKALSGYMLESKEKTNLLTTAAGGVATVFETLTVLGANVVYVFKGIGTEVEGIASQLAALGRGDFKGFSEIGERMKRDAIAARAEIDAFDAMIMNGRKNAGAGAGRGADPRTLDPRLQTPDAPSLPGDPKTTKTAADDPTKRALDNALKELDRYVDRERDILASRNKFLDLYNSENLLSIDDYYAGRKAAQDENVAETMAAYDREIAALEAYQAKVKKATDREATQGKINELIEKKAKLQRDASEANISDSVKQEKAYGDLDKQIRAVNASLLELQGNSAGAAKIRIEDQFEETRKRLTANKDTAGLARLDDLIKQQVAFADYNGIAQKGALIQDQLRNAEERASVSRQTGATTELDYLKQISAARLASVQDLEGITASLERVAASSQNPALLIQAESARVALEKLRAESDLISQKFDTIFADSASGAFADFISGTKSAKDAFKSFANSVNQEINRIISQEFASKLFGKGGAGNGISGLFGTMFGGGQSGKSGGQLSPTNGLGIMGDVPSLADSAKTGGGSALDALNKLFGGQSGGAASAAGATAADASLLGLSTAATATTTSLATMTASTTALDALTATLTAGFAALSASAEVAAAALASVAGSSGASGLGSLAGAAGSSGVDFGGFFADGGNPPLGKVSVVGERGPELFVPKQLGTIIPNKALGGGGSKSISMVNNFTINGPANRNTETQIAASVFAAGMRAHRRIG